MTYLEMEEIINHPYVGIKETMALAGVGYNKAREILNEIKAEMIADGFPMFNKRKSYVPTRRMVDKLHIDTEYVRREASQMKGVQYGDLRTD